jgi:hypothetical protein
LDYDESLMRLQIQLKKRDEKMVVNIRGELFKDLNEPLIVHAAHYEKIDDDWLNATASVCNIMSRQKSHPVLKMILKELLKNSNLPTGCPVKKGLYYLKDFMLNDDLLPPFLPTGRFMSLVKVSRLTEEGEVPAMKITVYADMKNTNENNGGAPFKFLN